MVSEFSALVQAVSALVVAVIAVRTASRPQPQVKRVIVKRERPQ